MNSNKKAKKKNRIKVNKAKKKTQPDLKKKYLLYVYNLLFDSKQSCDLCDSSAKNATKLKKKKKKKKSYRICCCWVQSEQQRGEVEAVVAGEELRGEQPRNAESHGGGRDGAAKNSTRVRVFDGVGKQGDESG